MPDKNKELLPIISSPILDSIDRLEACLDRRALTCPKYLYSRPLFSLIPQLLATYHQPPHPYSQSPSLHHHGAARPTYPSWNAQRSRVESSVSFLPNRLCEGGCPELKLTSQLTQFAEIPSPKRPDGRRVRFEDIRISR